MPSDPRCVVRAHVRGAAGERPRLDVDLTLGAGITALMGASGAGKSTLLVAMAGLLTPDRGRVALEGAVLFDSERGVNVPTHERRVALLFQSLALFPHLSALDNVAFGVPAKSRQERRERAHTWLTRARVPELGGRMPASLSGGEAQRVALARALASEPRALLLDEPFSALDASLRHALGHELRALVDDLHVPAILVTHHREDAERLAARVLTLDAGRLVADSASP